MGDSEVLHTEQHPNAVPRARQFVAGRLHGAGLGRLVDDAELAVAELVTNALLHAAPPVSLRVFPREDTVRLEVQDGSRSAPVRGPCRPRVDDRPRPDARRRPGRCGGEWIRRRTARSSGRSWAWRRPRASPPTSTETSTRCSPPGPTRNLRRSTSRSTSGTCRPTCCWTPRPTSTASSASSPSPSRAPRRGPARPSPSSWCTSSRRSSTASPTRGCPSSGRRSPPPRGVTSGPTSR